MRWNSPIEIHVTTTRTPADRHQIKVSLKKFSICSWFSSLMETNEPVQWQLVYNVLTRAARRLIVANDNSGIRRGDSTGVRFLSRIKQRLKLIELLLLKRMVQTGEVDDVNVGDDLIDEPSVVQYRSDGLTVNTVEQTLIDASCRIISTHVRAAVL
jgi:hypothetical protein